MVLSAAAADEQDRYKTFRNLSILCYLSLILSWTFVIVRTWVRVFLVRSFGWDDAIMVVGTVFFVGFIATVIVIIDTAFFPKIFPYAKTFTLIQLIVASEIMYAVTITTLKVSLCFFMRRIIVKRWHAVTNHVILGCALVSGIISVIFTGFRCGNPKYYPERQVTNKCWGGNDAVLGFAYQHGVVATATDFALMILPVSILASVRISRRSRAMLSCILLLGCAGCIAALVRFKYLNGLAIGYSTKVFLKNSVNIVSWSIIECTVCICCGCLATFRPLGHRFVRTRVGNAVSEKIKAIKFPFPKLSVNVSWRALPPSQGLNYSSNGSKSRNKVIQSHSQSSNMPLSETKSHPSTISSPVSAMTRDRTPRPLSPINSIHTLRPLSPIYDQPSQRPTSPVSPIFDQRPLRPSPPATFLASANSSGSVYLESTEEDPPQSHSLPSSHNDQVFQSVPIRYMPVTRAEPRVFDVNKPLPPLLVRTR